MTDAVKREAIETDVVIVGAGPAGLAAAIRLKQWAAIWDKEIAVTVVEKAAEIGGHILSGAVLDTIGLDELIPEWRKKGAPVGPAVTRERMHFLTESADIVIPGLLLPPQMKSGRDVIISLGNLCQWLAAEAEALGVEIYPMTAAVDLIRTKDGAVAGIVTGDLGRAKDGSEKDSFAAGIELRAKYTLLGEGARGSLSKRVIEEFGLARGRAPQTYNLGIKEIWEIPAELHEPGRVDNYLGFPLNDRARGGGFVYHAGDRRLYLGLVTGLDYENPTLSPFGEFQRFKTHPSIRRLIESGTRVSYGARALTAGGYQSIPQLAFPGGALIGCSAGFMNVPRLKGIHNAMRSGMGAAEAVAEAIASNKVHTRIEKLHKAVLDTGIGDELRAVRNVKPLWTRFGTTLGAGLAGIDMWMTSILNRSLIGEMGRKTGDAEKLEPLDEVEQISYDKPDGEITFDRASSVYLANLAHDEDQPVHLRLNDPSVPIGKNLPEFGEPAPLYCPAGVYEVVEIDGKPTFRIHAANCVHCKTCDIKDPAQNIDWVPPEGGSGPNYSGM